MKVRNAGSLIVIETLGRTLQQNVSKKNDVSMSNVTKFSHLAL